MGKLSKQYYRTFPIFVWKGSCYQSSKTQKHRFQIRKQIYFSDFHIKVYEHVQVLPSTEMKMGKVRGCFQMYDDVQFSFTCIIFLRDTQSKSEPPQSLMHTKLDFLFYLFFVMVQMILIHWYHIFHEPGFPSPKTPDFNTTNPN